MDVLPKMHVIIEILDARLPVSSTNPILTDLIQQKPCIKVLNKDDLADPEITREWVTFFEQQENVKAFPLTAKQEKQVEQIPRICRELAHTRQKPGKSIHAMVVGIPNVGKSTIINTLAGKKMARTGNRPALTTCTQQINLRNGIFLHDTPGLLWPKLEDQTGAYRLAASNAIGQNAIDQVDVALFAINFLKTSYPERIGARYNISDTPESNTALLEAIGKRRGCLLMGKEIDYQRTAGIFLSDLRGGKLGRISFETISDF